MWPPQKPSIEVQPMPTMEGKSRSYSILIDWKLTDPSGFRTDRDSWEWMHDQLMAIPGVAQTYPDPNSLTVGINRTEGASWDDIHPCVVELLREILRKFDVTDEVPVVEVPFRGFTP